MRRRGFVAACVAGVLSPLTSWKKSPDDFHKEAKALWTNPDPPVREGGSDPEFLVQGEESGGAMIQLVPLKFESPTHGLVVHLDLRRLLQVCKGSDNPCIVITAPLICKEGEVVFDLRKYSMVPVSLQE